MTSILYHPYSNFKVAIAMHRNCHHPPSSPAMRGDRQRSHHYCQRTLSFRRNMGCSCHIDPSELAVSLLPLPIPLPILCCIPLPRVQRMVEFQPILSSRFSKRIVFRSIQLALPPPMTLLSAFLSHFSLSDNSTLNSTTIICIANKSEKMSKLHH